MANKKRISRKQFVDRFTALAADYLAKLPPGEQDARIEAVGRIVNRRGDHSTPSRSADTQASPLVARGHHEAR